jgi:two-component system, LytTR family, response regulator
MTPIKIKYIVIDDEESCISELIFLIEKYFTDFECIGTANTTDAAAILFDQTQPDIAFCDISIGQNSIFEIISPQIAEKFKIIFVTGYQEFILKALRLSAIDYLLKPIVPEELIEALERYDQNRGSANTVDERLKALELNLSNISKFKKIGISTKNGYIFKEVNDLAYIEGKSNYCELHFIDNAKFTLAKTLLVQEEILEPFGFFRIHQSYLINLSKVELYNNNESTLKLTSGHVLPVSTRRKVMLLERVKSVI